MTIGEPYGNAYNSVVLDSAVQLALDHLLYALGYQGPRPKHYYMCHCPAHDDRRPSLSVTARADGRILIHCFAGCSTATILATLGLTPADLTPRGRRWHHRSQLKFPFYESIRVNPPTPFTGVTLVGKGERDEPLGKIVARYIYRDAGGQPLCQVARFEPKSFRLLHYLDGQWRWGLGGVRPPLYCLPELLAAASDEWVFVVEGEKDVETLYSYGLIATCNLGGADKWRGEYAQWLTRRRVCILPDNDEPGRSHAATIAEQLRGIAAAVQILELPGLPAKGDVSDWLGMGGDRARLLALANQVISRDNS